MGPLIVNPDGSVGSPGSSKSVEEREQDRTNAALADKLEPILRAIPLSRIVQVPGISTGEFADIMDFLNSNHASVKHFHAPKVHATLRKYRLIEQ